MLEFNVETKWEKRDDLPNERLNTISSGGRPNIECVPPPEFSGIPGYWTPEHLFVASAASCYLLTLLKVSKNSNLNVTVVKMDAKGFLVENDDGSKVFKKLVFEPTLTVLKESEVKKAKRIAQMAEKTCIIGNSITAEKEVKPTIEIA
ncbi:MAG: OsmC family protein [Candidatus Hodarchaeota archaeon]